MALNLSTFKTRTLTAIVFTIVMLTGLLWNQWIFLVLFVFIHFGCWLEFIKLIKLIHPGKYVYYLPLGLLYITLPILLLFNLRYNGIYHGTTPTDDYLKVIPCGIIFSIWVNDTMAYIVGSFIGKTPFSPISPKKTWEGTIGGAILCIVVITLTGWWTRLYTVGLWIGVSACCAVFGTLGDLLESKIKRMAMVKDSGTIMPGHGGFLDRFDSLLIATPFACLFLYLLMN